MKMAYQYYLKQASKQANKTLEHLWETILTHLRLRQFPLQLESHDGDDSYLRWRSTACGMLKNISATFHRFFLTLLWPWNGNIQKTTTIKRSCPLPRAWQRLGTTSSALIYLRAFRGMSALTQSVALLDQLCAAEKSTENHGMFTNMCIL